MRTRNNPQRLSTSKSFTFLKHPEHHIRHFFLNSKGARLTLGTILTQSGIHQQIHEHGIKLNQLSLDPTTPGSQSNPNKSHNSSPPRRRKISAIFYKTSRTTQNNPAHLSSNSHKRNSNTKITSTL